MNLLKDTQAKTKALYKQPDENTNENDNGVNPGLKLRAMEAATSFFEAQLAGPAGGAPRLAAGVVVAHGGSVYGAGVLLDDAGHVLTCDHVIDGVDRVEAQFDGDPTSIPVKIIARAKDVDLALLDVADAMVALQRFPGKLKVIGPVSVRQHMAVAFRPGAPRLREAFEAFLAEARRDGTYHTLVAAYFPEAPVYFRDFFTTE